jgi:hypothetical protein
MRRRRREDKHMKKVLVFWLICILLIACSCNRQEEVPITSSAENPTSQTTIFSSTTTSGPEPTLPIPENVPKEYMPVLKDLQRLIENSGQYADEADNPIDYKNSLGGEWGIYGWSQSIAGYAINTILQ